MTRMGTDVLSDGKWFFRGQNGGERVNRIWAMAAADRTGNQNPAFYLCPSVKSVVR